MVLQNSIMVAFSMILDGWGPMVYDIAMEVATQI